MTNEKVMFITACPQKHLWAGQTLNPDEATIMLNAIDIDSIEHIACDIETNGLDPFVNTVLLYGAKIGNDYFVVDTTTVNPAQLFERFYTITHIFHNAKFDISMLDWHYGKKPLILYDTMLANQKIYQNLPVAHALNAVAYRWLNITLNKDQRSEFINVQPHNFCATTDMINYLVNDLKYLPTIMFKQVEYLKFGNPTLLNWLTGVEFKLVFPLSELENAGMEFNATELLNVVKGFKDKSFNAAKRLDQIIAELSVDNIMLKGGKFTAERNQWEPGQQLDIFGVPMKQGYIPAPKTKRPTKVKTNTANINWSSSDQIVEVFGRLKMPLPLKDDEGYATPIIDEATGKALKTRAYDDNNEVIIIPGFTTDAKALSKYIMEHELSPLLIEFFEQLEVYNKSLHMVNSFGENYLDKIYSDGKIRTLFKQCATANGRLASGGGHSMPMRINAQNIPRDNTIRNLFIAGEGYEYIITDLSGAEVTIICDKANDKKLYNWAVKEDDAHSPIVTNSWKHIWLYRAAILAGIVTTPKEFFYAMRYKRNILFGQLDKQTNEHVVHAYTMYKTFVVSKKENPAFRQGGKNNTFGSLYNMGAAKAAETYNGTDNELHKRGIKTRVNVTVDEAKIALWAIKQAIPVSFKYMENNAAKALMNGSLMLSERSGSTVYFDEVLQIFKSIQKDGTEIETVSTNEGSYTCTNGEVYSIDWRTAVEISGQARNLPISGTQADMIKEMMVFFYYYFKKNNHPIHLVMQIHDELVYKAPVGYQIDGISAGEFINSNMRRIAKLFLNHFPMGAETEISPYWKK